MKNLIPFFILLLATSSCKKENIERYEGNGFIYTDGNPTARAGVVGWFYAETRNTKTYPLKESELPGEYKTITEQDSIPVTVSLQRTKTPVGCDCPSDVFYYKIISIRKRQ
jgi:hypothetical protein